MDYDYCYNSYQNFQSNDSEDELNDNFDESIFSSPFNNDRSSNALETHNDKKTSYGNEDDFEMLNQLFCCNSSLSTRNTNNLINKNMRMNSSRDNSKKKIKRKLELSNKAQYLKNNYYLIFTKKKKFPKTIIKKIHEIMMVHLNLKPITREISRFNDKYFEEFANESEKIIQYLVCNKRMIIGSIPELLDYIL